MARKDKILDVLALSTLDEPTRIARLAHQWIGKPFPIEQARAMIKCYFDPQGRTLELTDRLYAEKLRQEKLRNERQAFADAALLQARPSMDKYKSSDTRLKKRTMEIAKATFGPHVRDNFNAETLALMSLISGEDRWYQVKWLDAGFKPERSAVIEVITMKPKGGNLYSRFLLYRTNGRVLAAHTPGRTMLQAWGSQLPESFVAAVPMLQEQGYSFKSDLEAQEMVVFNRDGTEIRRVPWMGRTVDE